VVCERVLGNLDDDDFADARLTRELDAVALTWQECAKRFQRKQSMGGRDVGLLLPVGTRLRHGDVVHVTPGFLVYVSVIPCNVFVIDTGEPRALVRIAYELGDLHWPIEMARDGLIMPADEMMEGFLGERWISFRRESRRFHAHGVGREVRVARDFKIRTVVRSGA
jgi:urease accessory protein